MGISDFESEDDTVEAKVDRPQFSDDGKARPYVSREVHKRVNLFSANSALPMQVTYDTLLNKAVTNTNILELILVEDNEYSDDLEESEIDLLSDLVDKSNELGRFPTRHEINRDRDLKGFPIYITYLGKRKRIKRLISENFQDELNPGLDL